MRGTRPYMATKVMKQPFPLREERY